MMSVHERVPSQTGVGKRKSIGLPNKKVHVQDARKSV
jgi:hypothetical protein